jgi:hypothetical protein
MKALEAMSGEELHTYMKRLSRAVEELHPPGPSKHGQCHCALVLTDEYGKTHYVINNRRRMTKALRRTVARLERKQSNRLLKEELLNSRRSSSRSR